MRTYRISLVTSTNHKAAKQVMEGPHPLANDPQKAWEEMAAAGARLERLDPSTLAPSAPAPSSLRIVCISDTHNRLEEILDKIPEGDVLIHAGDFTNWGSQKEIKTFNELMGRLPHAHKLVVAGNHDKSFGKTGQSERLLTNCTYLADQSITIRGYKFFGSPWIPNFPRFSYGLPRGKDLFAKRALIPTDTDVLITHTPPVGHGDGCEKLLNRVLPLELPMRMKHKGDVDLLRVVQQRVKPKLHVFGHIHDAYGVTTDGQTIFVNAAAADKKAWSFRTPKNDPVVIDLPMR